MFVSASVCGSYYYINIGDCFFQGIKGLKGFELVFGSVSEFVGVVGFEGGGVYEADVTDAHVFCRASDSSDVGGCLGFHNNYGEVV